MQINWRYNHYQKSINIYNHCQESIQHELKLKGSTKQELSGSLCAKSRETKTGCNEAHLAHVCNPQQRAHMLFYFPRQRSILAPGPVSSIPAALPASCPGTAGMRAAMWEKKHLWAFIRFSLIPAASYSSHIPNLTCIHRNTYAYI